MTESESREAALASFQAAGSHKLLQEMDALSYRLTPLYETFLREAKALRGDEPHYDEWWNMTFKTGEAISAMIATSAAVRSQFPKP